MPRYFKAKVSHLVEICRCTACATQSPVCFFIAMSTPNIIQNAYMMLTFFRRDSRVTDGVISSSMCWSCTNISFLAVQNGILFSFIFTCDNAHSKMPKNASHVFGLSTATWLAPLSAFNDCGRYSSDGHIILPQYLCQYYIL